MVKFLKFSVVIEKDEDGYYVASVPELPGCHTQSKTLDELLERIKEAVELYLEVKGPITEVKREFIGIQFIEVGASEPKTAPSR
jgi:predicted RNase H-like HicB family nuclease